MSRVYEALKKAQREGRWHEIAGIPQAVAKPDPAPPGSRQPSREERTSGGQEISQTGQSLADSRLGQQHVPNTRYQINGTAAEETFPAEEALHSSPPTSGKVGQWRFWQRESSQQRASGPALIIHQESLTRAAEQFQVLRGNLESWAQEHGKRVILISSAVPGEGKSFVALNLAAALSHAGSEVILVDADLRSPSLHLPFNLVPLNGLLPYLQGMVEVAESVTATPAPRLKLIAAAGSTLSAPEAFASSRMRALLQHARELEPPPFVLIDAPAALAGPEAQILSRLVDGVLVVVRANYTPRAAVRKTLDLIKDAPLFSVVLNRFELSYSASRHLGDRATKSIAERSEAHWDGKVL